MSRLTLDMTRLVLSVIALCLCSCATSPKMYQPPDAARLIKSTNEVARAVNAAHASANSARSKVSDARARQKEIENDLKEVKDVPIPLLEKIQLQDTTLTQAAQDQSELESHFVEADTAKAQVEKDKIDYFTQAQKLADDASNERTKRIKAEQSLSWYRWHWYGSWIALGLGILACGVFAFLKFTGRLALKSLTL